MREIGKYLLSSVLVLALATLAWTQTSNSQSQLPENVQRDASQAERYDASVDSNAKYYKGDMAEWNKLHQDLARDKAKLQQDESSHAPAAQITKDRAAVQHDTELIQQVGKKAQADRADLEHAKKELSAAEKKRYDDSAASDAQHYKNDLAESNKLHEMLARDKAKLQHDEASHASAEQIAKDKAAVQHDTELIQQEGKRTQGDRQDLINAEKKAKQQ